MDKLEKQMNEFRVASDFANAIRAHETVAVVDAQYPQVRRQYEEALSNFMEALKLNNRFPRWNLVDATPRMAHEGEMDVGGH